MIAGLFHAGSGLGNQLHRYVATRVLAKDKGYDFSMVAPENFKGKSFMNLDMGIETNLAYHTELPSGKVVVDEDLLYQHHDFKKWEEKTNYYNPEFNFIEDNTIIDGEFQDERYFEHRLKEIDDWLHVKPLEMLDEICVINFRGGEFYSDPRLGLPMEYYSTAIHRMKEMGIKNFEVHTDDPALAAQFFPTLPIIHDIGINWRSLRYAKHAIISNSSFAILPRLLNGGVTIAPRYWARRNTKEWSMPQNYYKSFKYV